jgi:hypothetical protein
VGKIWQNKVFNPRYTPAPFCFGESKSPGKFRSFHRPFGIQMEVPRKRKKTVEELAIKEMGEEEGVLNIDI